MFDSRNRAGMHRTLAGVAILVTLPTYLALGARLWWVLDLATHFRVAYLLVLAPLGLIFLWTRKWRLLICVAVALAINVSLVAPLYFGESVPSETSSLRIVSINVLFQNSQHDLVLDVIRQETPDFVLLMEVDPSWQPVLATLESQFPYSLVETKPGSFGIALFSKFPLDGSQVLEIGSTGTPSIKAMVQVQETPVHLVCTHFFPPMSSANARMRNEQLIATAEELASTPSPKLLLGDLNITPWSPYFRDLLKLGNLRNSQVGFGIQPTWLATLPIDHLLHSDDIMILDRRIGPQVGSDHRPLIVDFAVKKEPN